MVELNKINEGYYINYESEVLFFKGEPMARWTSDIYGYLLQETSTIRDLELLKKSLSD